MRKSPDQALHDRIMILCQNLGYEVYNYLPDSKAPYPFCFVGEIFETDRRTKFNRFGDYQVNVHIYTDDPMRNRRVVVDMRSAIKNEFYKLKRTDGYQVLNHHTTGRVLPDNSTGTPLLHGILTCEATLN